MFTGIVEAQGKVLKLEKDKGNLDLFLSCSFLSELRVDQSLSHNGVCLTVCELGTDFYRVTAIPETLDKTNLGELNPGDMVNLERCMPVNGRFDGHIVQGHTDARGTCMKVEEDQGSWRLWFRHAPEFGQLTVEKGSICVNGVSLTVVESEQDYFSVAVIPYTWEHTNLSSLENGKTVNIEFDVLGKYIRKMLADR